MKIPFNIAAYTGAEMKHIQKLLGQSKLSGDGVYTKLCHEWFERNLNLSRPLLTTSASTALDMSSILANIGIGDEVIMPSFTFVSTANSFAIRGAKIVFVDIRLDTMNINENLIEEAITKKTKAIVPVHYAGISCEMNKIMEIAKEYNLIVIEDAAQGMMASYIGKPLGSIGNLGCYSFHDTKNYTAGGEGGLLIVNDEKMINRAEIIREKGTNRSEFIRGVTDKYTWKDIGSSFLPADLNAAYLLGNLESAEIINNKRISIWNIYYDRLLDLENRELLIRPTVPSECVHNGHMFYIKVKDKETRDKFISYMKKNDVTTPFHYVPLHTSPAGLKYGEFHGNDEVTTSESMKLIRLPIFYSMTNEQQEKVIELTQAFFA